MIEQSLSLPDRIDVLIRTEIEEVDAADLSATRTLAAFEAARCAPQEVTVNFSGGITQVCWRVTRSDGDYSVVYLPRAGYFALCVDSAFGPLDIGVHGPALACFGSV